MTEYITIAIIIGIAQIAFSIFLIARRKNVIANISEIISSLVVLFALNGFPFEISNILWMFLTITFIEYLCVKIILVIFIFIARYYSFYYIKAMCQKKKKQNNTMLKIVRAFHNAKYWPRLKLGRPGMADKVNSKTRVKFDSKGFPIFKSYYTVKLQWKDYRKSRQRHFHIANKMLYEEICSNKKLRAKFSKKQIIELQHGETPSGYTWHHHQDAGVLQLVEEEIHAKTYHRGGYSIWGGK